MKETAKKTNKDYGYKPITVLFDPSLAEEKELLDWLNVNRRSNNGYGAQIKRAIKALIDSQQPK
jgi:DnaJ-domain-containing protein 1